ncbi:KEOPS complex subunit Cgi121 [Halocatena halophila]|uniref:KEOPS complex subunit Cgi121 n=1 Tax=Halocatena halophila TaxID=2814576 RepID=UPI002ED63AF5
MRLLEGIVTVGDLDGFIATLGAIGDAHDATVQAFDARYVTGRSHLQRALELADRAFDRDENIADDRAVELLCYAAGRRQIDQALTMGLSTGSTPAVILVDGGDEAGAIDELESLLERTPTLGDYDRARVCSFFDITSAEVDATDRDLSALVEERVALLTIEK